MITVADKVSCEYLSDCCHKIDLGYENRPNETSNTTYNCTLSLSREVGPKFLDLPPQRECCNHKFVPNNNAELKTDA